MRPMIFAVLVLCGAFLCLGAAFPAFEVWMPRLNPSITAADLQAPPTGRTDMRRDSLKQLEASLGLALRAHRLLSTSS